MIPPARVVGSNDSRYLHGTIDSSVRDRDTDTDTDTRSVPGNGTNTPHFLEQNEGADNEGADGGVEGDGVAR